ncbi:hypothetical protein [Arthrobacter sp. ISL-30]|uniref:hypothetical protein n=1 Tax=Arthrobacter sp. ISL-30 TaxID=2819109 RepID=UPI001BE5BBDF|nr:hypothetical protein [Arthrobacter sp. ISL-30]MBT2513432.1 hypothetical protein [Arthrobacter sp. ISL-30]
MADTFSSLVDTFRNTGVSRAYGTGVPGPGDLRPGFGGATRHPGSKRLTTAG